MFNCKLFVYLLTVSPVSATVLGTFDTYIKLFTYIYHFDSQSLLTSFLKAQTGTINQLSKSPSRNRYTHVHVKHWPSTDSSSMTYMEEQTPTLIVLLFLSR